MFCGRCPRESRLPTCPKQARRWLLTPDISLGARPSMQGTMFFLDPAGNAVPDALVRIGLETDTPVLIGPKARPPAR